MADDNGEVNSDLAPRNIEAEKALLGSCLLDNGVIPECIGIVSECDFFDDHHKVLWRTIVEIHRARLEADAVTLADRLIERGWYKIIGGNDALKEIVDSVPHAANAKYYASIVKEKACAREASTLKSAMIAKGVKPPSMESLAFFARLKGMSDSGSGEVALPDDLRWVPEELVLIAELTQAGLVQCKLRVFIEESPAAEPEDYGQYLDSPGWKDRAEAAKERAGWRCQICNTHRSRAILDTHHRTYERRGHELDTDLVVLCRACHDLFHENRKLAR